MTVSQSNKEFLMARELTVQVNRWMALKGGVKRSSKMMTYEEKSASKKSVVTIVNEDNSFGYRAITLGLKYNELNVQGNGKMPEWRRFRENSGTLFSSVIELLERYGIEHEILDQPLDDEGLKLFDERLTEYQIIVIDRVSMTSCSLELTWKRSSIWRVEMTTTTS